MNSIRIIPYRKDDRDRVIDLALRAWSPAFAVARTRVPAYVHRAFYPNGWQVRQIEDIGRLLDSAPQNVLLAYVGGDLVGFVGTRLRPADSLGEIRMLAAAPDSQPVETERALMKAAEDLFRRAGMAIAMVETSGDAGESPARDIYAALGYESTQVLRRFKPL
ncbi:GNAT family N-acetyltransferase [Roseivivax sediminis]|uniref:Acetyltransferase (GNAT) domain-containing protein n=1 Tax=Roseivivax sediminis TaxID=936889 RepID=A0A1I2DR82_9RHOB|nr:GNAT family N-acetyltransferase [Roseivivax sediminis]SFE82781.1 Acetyltransferase (GNAT) domain-containing protein [Roseivivax sediminis]